MSIYFELSYKINHFNASSKLKLSIESNSLNVQFRWNYVSGTWVRNQTKIGKMNEISTFVEMMKWRCFFLLAFVCLRYKASQLDSSIGLFPEQIKEIPWIELKLYFTLKFRWHYNLHIQLQMGVPTLREVCYGQGDD